MCGILLWSRARSLQIKPGKTSEMIASSDKGSDSDPFDDLDKDEDQTEETWASWVQWAWAKVSAFALV